MGSPWPSWCGLGGQSLRQPCSSRASSLSRPETGCVPRHLPTSFPAPERERGREREREREREGEGEGEGEREREREGERCKNWLVHHCRLTSGSTEGCTLSFVDGLRAGGWTDGASINCTETSGAQGGFGGRRALQALIGNRRPWIRGFFPRLLTVGTRNGAGRSR